jgi:hypothetical protein
MRRLFVHLVAASGILLGGGQAVRADIQFQQTSPSPVSTSVNIGDFQRAFDSGNNPILNSLIGLNLNNNNTFGQNTPLITITTFNTFTGTTGAGATGSDLAGVTASNIQPQAPNGGGQSIIVLSTGANPLGFLDVTPINPPLLGFSVIEFNPMSSNDITTQPPITIQLFAEDQFGTWFGSQVFTYDLNGQNRLAAVASNGEYIVDFRAVVIPPANDTLRQFRIDGVLANGGGGGGTIVPEPASFVLLGVGGIGILGARLRRRAA